MRSEYTSGGTNEVVVRGILFVVVGVLAAEPCARAKDVPAVSPFIGEIAGLAVYVRAAPVCGVRSGRWSRDLFDAIVGIIEQTRDGNAAHVPSHADIVVAMGRVAEAHRSGEALVRLKAGSSCQNLRGSEGLIRADALVRRHRDQRVVAGGPEVAL